MDIYVGNLSNDTTEKDLEKVFEAHGEVSSVIIMKDKVSSNPLGFGFVEMPDAEEGLEAVGTVNKTEINSRVVMVSETIRQADRRERSMAAAESTS